MRDWEASFSWISEGLSWSCSFYFEMWFSFETEDVKMGIGLSEWLSCLLTLGTRDIFLPLAKLMSFRDIVGFISAHRHNATALTRCKGKICSPLRRGRCSCFWRCQTKQLHKNFCPNGFTRSYAPSGQTSVCSPQRGRGAGPAAGTSSHALSSSGLRSQGGKQKECYISPSYICFMFWNTRYKSCDCVFAPAC